jgi:ADP-L-glycero-D-manno-heptose 6-epimerase
MIIITGGAGMIGSMVAWHFNAHSQRDDLVLVDRILEADQWQNYCRRDIVEYLDKDELFPWLAARSPKGPRVDAVIHMGAISATTERDFSLLLETNIRYSQRLWEWCAANEVPYLYASSAATYGGGELGYADSHDIAALRPLNGYGFSKQYFDRWALRQAREGKPTPPFWYGFKFFNVYGPNEYHKGRMASVVYHTFNQTRASGGMKLFRSHRPDYADGMQMRDFVYVKDAAAVLAHFVEQNVDHGRLPACTTSAPARPAPSSTWPGRPRPAWAWRPPSSSSTCPPTCGASTSISPRPTWPSCGPPATTSRSPNWRTACAITCRAT